MGDCGIFGVFLGPNPTINLERVVSSYYLKGNAFLEAGSAATGLVYYGLSELQNRGQDSSGIVVSDGRSFRENLGAGLVIEAYKEGKLRHLTGHIAIGHNRYSTTGIPKPSNIQPFRVGFPEPIALAHNGNIVNQQELRESLECMVGGLGFKQDLELRSTTDSEVLLHLIAADMAINTCSIEEAISNVLGNTIGSYSLLIETRDKLIGVRDPYENRPLHLAYIGGAHMFSSERRVFTRMMFDGGYRKGGSDFIREVKGGEIITVTKEGLSVDRMKKPVRPMRCSFEKSYLMNGSEPGVYNFRLKCGERLWEEDTFKERLLSGSTEVIGVSDSGLISSLGYSTNSGLTRGLGLRRDHNYQKRTFIEAYQEGRSIGTLRKYYVISEDVKDKKVVLVDDSIVRSTTMSNIIKMMRWVGEVDEFHARIATPPYITPCYLGIHTPEKDELIAHGLNEEQAELFFMARFYGVDYDKKVLKGKVMENKEIYTIVQESVSDGQNYLTDEERGHIDPKRFSLRYLSLEGFKDCFGEERDKMCYACFVPDGKGYPEEMRRHLVGKV